VASAEDFGDGGLQCFGVGERVQRALHTSAVRYAGAGLLLHRSAPLTMHLCTPPFGFSRLWFGTREHEQSQEATFGRRSQTHRLEP
jgi:hypothetical protein